VSKFDPYEILNIPPDAKEDEIKDAFKVLARKTHPDHGGNALKFAEVRAAYECLMDPERRKEFDECGVIGSKAPDNTEATAKEHVARFFIETINAMLADPMLDDRSLDLIQGGRRFFEEKQRNNKRNIRDLEKIIEKTERVMKRLKCKRGNDPVQLMLRNHVGELKNKIKWHEQQTKINDKALVILEDYSFENEPYLTTTLKPLWMP
jgi:curved DNA-binding protein CbpA